MQGILPPPAVLFHMEHPKNYNAKSKEAREHIDEKSAAFFCGSVMEATKTASTSDGIMWYNDDFWGMRRYDLPEHYV